MMIIFNKNKKLLDSIESGNYKRISKLLNNHRFDTEVLNNGIAISTSNPIVLWKLKRKGNFNEGITLLLLKKLNFWHSPDFIFSSMQHGFSIVTNFMLNDSRFNFDEFIRDFPIIIHSAITSPDNTKEFIEQINFSLGNVNLINYLKTNKIDFTYTGIYKRLAQKYFPSLNDSNSIFYQETDLDKSIEPIFYKKSYVQDNLDKTK